MLQWLKAHAATSNDLSSVLGTHKVEEGNRVPKVLWPLHAHCDSCAYKLICIQRKVIFFYFKKVIHFITKVISTYLPITARGDSVSSYKIQWAYLSGFRHCWNKMIKLYCNNYLCLSATLLWGGFISWLLQAHRPIWTEIERLCSHLSRSHRSWVEQNQ